MPQTNEAIPDLLSANGGLVSVIVPTFNKAAVICDTLESVRNQTYRPLELIIVDDGSTDETHAICERWIGEIKERDTLAASIFRTSNRGPSAARNTGFERASGTYIQYLDSDDLLHPQKIARQVMCACTNDVTVYGQCRRFVYQDPQVLVLPEVKLPRPSEFLSDWLKGSFINPHSFLWRREDVLNNGAWDERLSPSDDAEYAMRFLLKGGTWKYCSNTWSYYRTYFDTRPRVSTRREESALQTMLDVTIGIEREIMRLGLLSEELRYALACQYWNVAKRAAFVPSVQQTARARYNKFRDGRSLPEAIPNRVLYSLLGIAARRRLVDFARIRLGLKPFPILASVRQLSDLFQYDEPKK